MPGLIYGAVAYVAMLAAIGGSFCFVENLFLPTTLNGGAVGPLGAALLVDGGALFAGGMTAYILVGIRLEERDLVGHFGDVYREYRKRVPMLIPWRRP